MSVHTLRLPIALKTELTYLEDRADYIRAAAVLEKVESSQMKTKSLSEVMAKYDLAN